MSRESIRDRLTWGFLTHSRVFVFGASGNKWGIMIDRRRLQGPGTPGRGKKCHYRTLNGHVRKILRVARYEGVERQASGWVANIQLLAFTVGLLSTGTGQLEV